MGEKDFRISLLKYLDDNNAHHKSIDAGKFIFRKAGSFQEAATFFNRMVKDEMIMGTLKDGGILQPDMDWNFTEKPPEINIVITRQGEQYLNDYKNRNIYFWTLMVAILSVLIGLISLCK